MISLVLLMEARSKLWPESGQAASCHDTPTFRGTTMTGGDANRVDGSRPQGERQPSLHPRTVSSNDLLQGEREVLITHGMDVYRLRLTRNGKLILQK